MQNSISSDAHALPPQLFIFPSRGFSMGFIVVETFHLKSEWNGNERIYFILGSDFHKSSDLF